MSVNRLPSHAWEAIGVKITSLGEADVVVVTNKDSIEKVHRLLS
jgi:hypothetical protein